MKLAEGVGAGLVALVALGIATPARAALTDAAADAGVVATDAGGADESAPAPVDARPVAPVLPLVAPAAPVPLIKVVGGVFGRGGSDPVLGATIVVDAFAITESDEAGSFEITVAPGRHRLQIQAPGFDLADLPIEVTAGMSRLTVRLSPRQSGERYQTVVSAPGWGGIALAGDDLTRSAGSLGEPFRVLESLPGVTQVAWPLSLYAVRGANPGNTGFFIDGVRLPALFHLGLGPAVIHPFFLERFDFYPGGYPAKYGRFVSGIVAASTATPKPDRVRGSADLRLFDAGGIIATPIDEGKGTVVVAGRYSYTGLIFSALSPEYTLAYWDYQARLDHELGPGRFTVFAFGSHDHLGHKLYADTEVQIDFHRLDLRWQGAVGPGRLLAGMSIGGDRSKVSLDPVVKLPVRISNRSLAPRVQYLVLRDKFEVEGGLDAEIMQLDPRSEREDTRDTPLFQKRIAAAAGAYSSLTWRPTADIEVTPVLRADVFWEGKTRRRYEPSPRLSLRYRPFGGTSSSFWSQTWLKAQVGRYAQAASLPIAAPGFESFGLGSLGTQTSKQGSFGVEQEIGDALSLDVSGYYQRTKLTDLLSLFNYDPQDPRLLERRDGESYGLEVMLRRPPSHRFYGWVAYTLSKSMRLVGPSGAKSYSDWDQRHVFNLVMGLRLPAGFTLGTRFHLNTGRFYPVFDDDDPGPPDYRRLPTFYQADIRIDKRFVFDRFVLDVYVEAVNATLTKQVFDVKREMGIEVEKHYQIVLPSLGLHAEW